jgi:predicted metal-binding membrane protein
VSVACGMARGARDDSQRSFYGAVALLFAVSAAATIDWCASMSTIGMPMPGGWTMSMTWMRMPGQTWSAAGASFLGMWMLMMTAMMLPSLTPALLRYRRVACGHSDARLGLRTALVGAGYFMVWAALGTTVFPLGIAVAAAEMKHPALAEAVPLAVGVVVLLAGALQFTAWKARQLACCRVAPDLSYRVSTGTGAAVRHGMYLGLRCAACCAGLMLVLLAIGVMDLRAMAFITAAITIERLAGECAARVIGGLVSVAGLYLIGRALL